jgi:bifunctional non-homologous end joining protein LigD
VPLPVFQPLPLDRSRSAFSHPDWLFEVKWDGFRSLVYIDDGDCKLVSRNGNQFKSFAVLNASLLAELSVRSAVLDGEIICLDEDGRPQFRDLLFRRGQPRFMAFDLLFINGEDLQYSPLIERKKRLRAVVPVVPKDCERLLYCDHVEQDGEGLFRLACHNDLEGIVAKRMFDPYLPEHTSWLKIRNQQYSQWNGRQELFDRERASNPDARLWDECVLACESANIY